jgi:hypothetical protein
MIAGALSFESQYLVNGVVINENLRGQSLNLFIEDAIQETKTSTGAISAEYGRFGGGVVNMISDCSTSRSGFASRHSACRLDGEHGGDREAQKPVEMMATHPVRNHRRYQ